MLLKCKQCGYENQIGSIFCRGCGAKIDSSALDPDSPDAVLAQAQIRKEKAVEIITVILKRAVTCLILLFLILTLCFLFAESHAPKYSDAVKADFDTTELKKRMDDNQDVYLSPEAMTALFKEEVMTNITDTKGSYTPREVIFECDKENKNILKIYIHTNIAGINTVCTLRGRLHRGQNGSILFDLLSVRLGKVDLPCAKETIAEKFDAVLKHQAIKELFHKAESVQFENGELQIRYVL